jgi:hypothetical protein
MTFVRRPAPTVRFAITIACALMASFTAVMTTPRPVIACSCVGFTSWKEAVTPETAVFAGTAGPREARGVPVRVERWFQGKGAAPTVWLAGGSFNGIPGISNSCGIDPPPAGSSWLWVGWPAEDGTFGTGLCSPAARLDSPEGQAMLAEAVTAFGEAPAPAAETAPPTAEAPLPTAAPGPADIARDQTAIAVLSALLLGSLALFGGVVLAARRSARGGGRDGG